MAETQKEELDLEEFKIKEEIVSIKDTSYVDTDIKGKLQIY